MAHEFDKDYWDGHYQRGAEPGRAAADHRPVNPHLVVEIGGLIPGTALDAGCGEGVEALWLARNGWNVTAADIASEALDRAKARGSLEAPDVPVRWVEADLSVWEPDSAYDLVATHYAHPAMPQLDFYRRLARWVAPGGTLLVVGHLRPHAHTGGHGHPPVEATVSPSDIVGLLEPSGWTVATAAARVRTAATPGGDERELHDVVVRASRLP